MSDDSFTTKLFAGLEVLKSQQSEINRRLGLLEKAIADLPETARLESLERWRDSENIGQFNWKHKLWEAALWVVGVTLAATLINALGIPAVF